MTAANRASNCRLFWGAAGFQVELTGLVDQGFALQGVGNIVRRRVLGQRGQTADGASAGLAARVAMRTGAAAARVAANRRGFLVVYRSDAVDCIVLPAILTGISTVSPAAGVVTRVANFVQDGEDSSNLPVWASGSTKVKTSGSVTVASGELGYEVTQNSIVRATGSSISVSGNDVLACAGTPLRAEV